MPRVFRQQYTRPIPDGAERVTARLRKNGKEREVPAVRFRDAGGKFVVAPLTAGGDRCRVPSPYWYGKVNGVAVRLATNKAAAEIMLAELIKKAELGKAGVADPFEEHSKRPLVEHLDHYHRELSARGNDPRYVRLVFSRLAALLRGCRFAFIADLSASRVMDWLADLRRRGGERISLPEGQGTFTGKETAGLLGISVPSVWDAVRRHGVEVDRSGKRPRLTRAAVEALLDRRGQGASVQTTNYYLSHLKSFCHWLVKDRRMADNPLAHLEAGNAGTDRRHDRRDLEADELRRLLAAARASDRSFRGLTGADRFHLYATACGTGFRASALASLTPESFDLGADVPTVTLSVKRDKSRRGKVQPLPPDVADLLRAYLRDRPPGAPVWGGTWAKGWKGAEMLRLDLEAAGIPYAVEGPDGPLYADFHALRHSYLTLGGRAGIDLRTLQELAGHSTPTLTARYSHRRLHDLAGAVEKLPNLLPTAEKQTEARRGTGTEGDADPPQSPRTYTPLTQAVGSGRERLRLVEAPTDGEGRGTTNRNCLSPQGVEAVCDRVRAVERREAPPGFEPGITDLQSAALPLGEGAESFGLGDYPSERRGAMQPLLSATSSQPAQPA
jgi:integrase/recombinase XerC